MPWTGQYTERFVRLMGLVDLAGGLGILLAALGCATLQVCAQVFHLSRGKAMVLTLNRVLLGLSLFVLCGRSQKAPILSRHPWRTAS